MKIYKPIGSKERFAEIFQGVNKVKLNEGFGQSYNPQAVLEMAFEGLKNGTLNIVHSNSQGEGEQSFIELVCKDKQGNNITFTFKTLSSADDQEGVYNINNVIMTGFSFDDPSGEDTVEMDENALKQFNSQHGNDLFDAVKEYIDVEEEEPAIDELYEDAIRKIDLSPFGKYSFDKMQTGKAYADEKPINPAIRVKSPELDKFVNEDDLDKDVSLGMNDTTTKMISTVSPELKEKIILDAAKVVDRGLERQGISKDNMPKEAYNKLIKQIGLAIFEEYSSGMNENINEEEAKVGDYPDQMGKKFKPKVFYPKKKRKPQTSVKLSEFKEPKTDDDQVADTEFMNKERQGLQGGEDDVNPDTTNDVNPEVETGTENDVEAGDEMSQLEKDNPDLYPKGWKEMDGMGMGHEPESDEIDQIAQDKEETGEVIPGGDGEEKSASEFDPEQILMGMRVEMEHSDDPMYALEIAIDHLTEDPEYYTSEETPEDSAQANAVADANGDDKNTEDILLGFKPHNVGDEVPDTSRKPRMTELKESAKPEDKKKVDNKGNDTKASTDTSSDTASDTSTETSTKTSTSTEAYTQGNITITGGAGAGDTHVTINGQLAKPTTKTGTSKVGTVNPKKVNESDEEPETPEEEKPEELKKKEDELDESKKIKKNVITEEQIKTAKLTLSKRNIPTGMTKKEAVQILINNNLKKIL
jgi:hypothetical protein